MREEGQTRQKVLSTCSDLFASTKAPTAVVQIALERIYEAKRYYPLFQCG